MKNKNDRWEESYLDREEYKGLQDEVSERRDLENTKKFLQEENKKYRDQIKVLTEELAGVDIAIAATEAYSAAYEERRRKFNENMEKLQARKEALTAEVSQLYGKIKAAREDEQSTAILIENMSQELEEIRNEKAIISKRLESVRAGIERISRDKETKLPYLQEYDGICRQIRTVLKDAQNRMEVSLKLRQKWDW